MAKTQKNQGNPKLSDDRLLRIAESARLGWWEWNIETGELVWSKESLEMFGLPLDTKMSYERFVQAIHPEDREAVDQAVQAAIKSGDEYSSHMRAVWPDGSVHWIASRGRVYFNKAGEPIRMSGAGMDITQFKETEDNLRRTRAEAKAHADNLAAILDAVPALTLIADDPECKQVQSSRFGYEVAGLPQGVNVSAAAPPSERQAFKLMRNGRELAASESPLREAAQSGKELRNREVELHMASGKVLHLFGHATPLFSESGAVRGAVGAFLDITELKNVQAELERARAEAKAQADNFAAVFDAVPAAAFFSNDRDCKTMISNRAAYEMLRLPYGSNTSKSAPEPERPTFKIFENGRELKPEEMPVQRAALTGEPVRDKEFEIRFEDGSSIHEFGHAVPLFDQNGEVRGAVGAFMDITDRKVVEQRLRAATERFQVALRNTPITVFSQDLDLRYKWMYNPASGYDVAQILGKRDRDFLERREDAEKLEAIKSEVMRSGKIFQGEVQVHHQGSVRTYHVTIEPQRDSQNNIVGLTCASFDMTERKREEAERERLARQRQLALDAARMAWWHYDTATDTCRWDEAFRNVLGVSVDSMSGKDLIHSVHPEDVAEVSARFSAALNPSDPRPYVAEYRMVRPDGEVRWVEAYAAPESEGEGDQRRIVSVSGTVRDITERKAAEEVLLEHRSRSEFVAEGSDVGFWFCDLPFDKLIWDKRVKRHFWLPEDESPVPIETFYAILHPDDREPTRLAIETSITSNLPYDVEYRTMAPDGRCRWVRAIGRTFYDASGKPVRFDGITQDITARKQAEQALRESEARHRELAENLEREVQMRTRELEERNKEIVWTSEGLRVLSSRLLLIQDEERRRIARELHDSAGQTLTALSLEMAAIRDRLRADAPDAARQVEGSEELLRQLHSEIRTTSYLLHPPLLDEAGLFSAISWYTRGINDRSGIRVELDMPASFGRLPRDTELVVFRLVQESLTNIHRHSGSKTAQVRLSRQDDLVTVEVCDQGKGIDPARLAAIRSGGSGVGIRGMRERLHQLRGELRIESSDAGTQVVASIPIAQTPADEPSSESVRTAG
jgi:PAS domain S-box-containing protein